jgi:hypothetical protein
MSVSIGLNQEKNHIFVRDREADDKDEHHCSITSTSYLQYMLPSMGAQDLCYHQKASCPPFFNICLAFVDIPVAHTFTTIIY